MIRAEVNLGDSLKSILNVGDFTRQFKSCYHINAGDSPCHEDREIKHVD